MTKAFQNNSVNNFLKKSFRVNLTKMISCFIRLTRLNQPIGSWLLLLPCLWSITLASPVFPDPQILILFTMGAVIMRASGCIINDIADKDFDQKVARTSTRPIASNEITVFQALLFLIVLLTLGFLILLQFNKFTIIVGLFSLSLILIYPFVKRVSYWPQAVLGLTFNWGALLGWASVCGELELTPIILYLAGFFWTLGYDTIYAHQDKNDDILIGVKSTAIKFGNNTKVWLLAFYSFAIFLFIVCGYLQNLNWMFFGGISIGALHNLWQVYTINIDDTNDCYKKFISNRNFGLIILSSFILSKINF